MPTYDYECDACGHELEVFQAMTDAPRRKCPDCGKLKLQRRIGGGAAVIFKGSGFYETDYRSASYKRGVESARKERADATTKKTDAKKESGKKAESKPSKSKKSKE